MNGKNRVYFLILDYPDGRQAAVTIEHELSKLFPLKASIK